MKRLSKRAIDESLARVRADPTDVLSRLKLAALYAKAGDLPNALEQYEFVAKQYVDLGFALKAIAVYKMMCQTVVRDAPELRTRYAHVPPVIADLLERLGVHELAVEALDALGPSPSSGSHGPS